ncbi:MAG: exo-alpha-sialidase [Phycisphaerales bacterium]
MQYMKFAASRWVSVILPTLLHILMTGARADTATCEAVEIFPVVQQHVHGSTIVELPNGDLLAAWFQGSGERWADDVAIMGARRKAGAAGWSKPFLMADVPGFPDINPILFLDSRDRLWLMWYTVIANQWETSLLKYRLSEDYTSQAEAPRWTWQEVLHVKPGDPTERGIQPGDRFVKSVERQIEEYATYLQELHSSQPLQAAATVGLWRVYSSKLLSKARGEDMVRKGILQTSSGESTPTDLGYPYFRRMGWQTKNKAVLIDGKRLIVPLYSDGFSFSLMAITDDNGATWHFSEPLVGAGNIQPSIARKADGALVAYMRDNGPPPQRLHVSTSADKGLTWSTVHDSELPNPGSGADIVTLRNGHWILVYNDTEDGRHSLAVSLSTDEGRTWSHTRRLEHSEAGDAAPTAAYPSIVQGADGSLHVVYSYRSEAGKTIKHVRFTESWVMGM